LTNKDKKQDKKQEYTIKVFCTKKRYDELMWWLLAQEIKGAKN